MANRGRPKGSRNRPKDETASEATKLKRQRAAAKPKPEKVVESAAWRPEDLTEEQLRVVFLQNVAQVQRADAALKKAHESRTSALSKARAEYGETFLEDMKLDAALQEDSGKKLFRSKIENAARIARWNNIPIQEELFAEDRMPIEDRAFEEGKRVGMAGGDPTAPGHYGGPLASRFTEGWHAGQAVARKRLESMQTPPPARYLDEGTEVFDYYQEGYEARRRGEVGHIPEGYSGVQGKEWIRGWGAAADKIDGGDDIRIREPAEAV